MNFFYIFFNILNVIDYEINCEFLIYVTRFVIALTVFIQAYDRFT